MLQALAHRQPSYPSRLLLVLSLGSLLWELKAFVFKEVTYLLGSFADIMNHKPRLAWELYLKMETSGESFSLLQLIANDCYKVGRLFLDEHWQLP